MRFKFILCILIIFSSCRNEKDAQKPVEETQGKAVEITLAVGFTIKEFKNYSLVTVKTPWPDADNGFTYLLSQKGANLPKSITYDQKVEIPVQEIVVTSTTHIPALEALGVEDKLTGFPGLDFISSEKTRKRINSGAVQELGQNENINTEVLIDLSPDLVMGFAINGQNRSLENIKKTGIPVVFNADWMEKNPLGKAEWIKFIGAFFNKTAAASEVFREIEKNYNEAKTIAASAEKQPTVIGGSMYKDQWFMPYGNSWQAKFIADANANYLYSETEGNGSIALSFENVLEKAEDADFWVSTGQFTSYHQLINTSRHYQKFKAVQNKKVYSVSLSKGETGGAIYFELGPQRPDLVLKDLIGIFHPNLLTNHKQLFFKPLEQ